MAVPGGAAITAVANQPARLVNPLRSTVPWLWIAMPAIALTLVDLLSRTEVGWGNGGIIAYGACLALAYVSEYLSRRRAGALILRIAPRTPRNRKLFVLRLVAATVVLAWGAIHLGSYILIHCLLLILLARMATRQFHGAPLEVRANGFRYGRLLRWRDLYAHEWARHHGHHYLILYVIRPGGSTSARRYALSIDGGRQMAIERVIRQVQARGNADARPPTESPRRWIEDTQPGVGEMD